MKVQRGAARVESFGVSIIFVKTTGLGEKDARLREVK